MPEQLDTSDIERYLGVPTSRTYAVEPIHVNDIRRWTQALRHPNRLHFDANYAEESRYGRIVAPQSFTVNCESGHGARPALLGNIPDSHMLYGGDEWWFFGPRIFAGDLVSVDHMPFDFRRTETKFAGPTVIQRGDNNYVNQRGERIALQRASAIRYKPSGLRSTQVPAGLEDEPRWTPEMLEQLSDEKHRYVQTISSLGHDRRPFETISVGDKLPTKVIGPHSVASFATEWRAYNMNTWNTMVLEHLIPVVDEGYTEEMSYSKEKAAWDPEFADGAYYGASRGHLFAEYAQKIGMPRPYGYGASLGAWIIDYLASWAGEWGYVAHCNSQYRGPALAGDVTYLRGVVTSLTDAVEPEMGKVHVDYRMSNQRGETLASGSGEILLPRSGASSLPSLGQA